MLSDEAFQKLLFDLFCLWHDVQRHYDPPITHTEEEKMQKVKQMICKLLGEIDSRVKKVKELPPSNDQEFIEEWTMLTWNVLCITSRFQNSLSTSIKSSEDKVIFSKLNVALVELVNHARDMKKPPTVGVSDATFDVFANSLSETMHNLHGLYRTLKLGWKMNADETQKFAQRLQLFADQNLIPFVEMFKSFCNEQSIHLWQDVREAQISRMVDYRPMPHEPVNRLVSFYSHMMHRLAILCARLQGFRYELTMNKVFGDSDPVRPLSDSVFSALELLMSDCVLATEPSTNPILVTNNLFAINCGALARGVVFKQFDIQIVTEEAAEHIQSEMRRQKMLQQPSPIAIVPSAALLAMKPTSGTKRANQSNDTQSSATSHKKSDVNSKEIVTIYPVFNSKNRYWAASYPHLLCTTRQKGRHSTHNSFQDLSPGGVLDAKSNGKRPIFYFHIRATMFSPSGRFADAHTLSLPLTIATRRNQDCQVQRMMSSYTATCFWLYGNNFQDGLLLQWVEAGMSWEKFKILFAQHFRVNAEVQRGLQDCDFDLLQYKIQCNDCKPVQFSSSNNSINGNDGGKPCGRFFLQQFSSEFTSKFLGIITFKNMLCPHLRYECGSTNVRFSVWRGMLELLQIFQDTKTNVRKLWEKNLIMGFLEFDQVSAILANHQSALIMRLSFVTGGTICFTVKSNAHSLQKGATAPMHLEPLDLKKLQAKCLKDYLRDIAVAEKVKYIINSNCEPILIRDVVSEMFSDMPGGPHDELETSRHISSNVTHVGDIDAMQHITFTAMRIAVVTCKVKPPSADMMNDLESAVADSVKVTSPPIFSSSSSYNYGSNVTNCRLSAQGDDFVREIIQLCNFHGKSKQDLVDLLDKAPEHLFAHLSISSSNDSKNGIDDNLLSSQQQQQPLQRQQSQQQQISHQYPNTIFDPSIGYENTIVTSTSEHSSGQLSIPANTFAFQYSSMMNPVSTTPTILEDKNSKNCLFTGTCAPVNVDDAGIHRISLFNTSSESTIGSGLTPFNLSQVIPPSYLNIDDTQNRSNIMNIELQQQQQLANTLRYKDCFVPDANFLTDKNAKNNSYTKSVDSSDGNSFMMHSPVASSSTFSPITNYHTHRGLHHPQYQQQQQQVQQQHQQLTPKLSVANVEHVEQPYNKLLNSNRSSPTSTKPGLFYEEYPQ